jgi:2'-5' RNA ligase
VSEGETELRLFIGLEIPAEVRDTVALKIGTLKPRLPAARWVHQDNFHFTLVFLGEANESRLPDLQGALTPVFGAWSSFRLQLEAAGSFPPRRPARVLWIGLKEDEVIRKLQAEVWRAVDSVLDLEADWKPYHPHLTVARCPRAWPRRAVDSWRQSVSGPVAESFPVSRGVLFCSHLSRRGATYEVVQSYPFEGGE